MSSSAVPALVGTRTSHRDALVLLATSAADRRRALIDLAATTIHTAVERHLRDAEPPVIAAGHAVTSWRALPAALCEAADAPRPHAAGPRVRGAMRPPPTSTACSSNSARTPTFVTSYTSA
ncbi:MAG: hypothetical protein JO262_20545 [Solirubrobacterales bacterium]|nr:hypothetical protein [Solirubrobacterales bacterium]MBV9944527.1 hypothetical protein [Solirubrobacterales bacterium]